MSIENGQFTKSGNLWVPNGSPVLEWDKQPRPVVPIGEKTSTKVSPWLTTSRQKVRFPNGHEGEFTYVDDDYAAATTVPLDRRRGKAGIVLARQYRFPSDSQSWEVPAGRPDEGETDLEAAVREVEEEIGYSPRLIEQLPSQIEHVGRGNSRSNTFVGADLKEVGQRLDATEAIKDVEWFTYESVRKMIVDGGINTAHTIGAIGAAMAFIEESPDHEIARYWNGRSQR